MVLNADSDCYCKSRKKFKDCCHPFLAGRLNPETPEQLMRSRYAAFCVKNIEYLLATHHPSKQLPNETDALAKSVQETQWLGLNVLKTQNDSKNTNTGFVEFVAFYKDTRIRQLHERSQFVREENQWYYLDGVMLEPLKFTRNQKCWCGSQKKYKRCHGQFT